MFNSNGIKHFFMELSTLLAVVFVNALRYECFDDDFEFELYDYDDTNKQIIKVKYTGYYVIVDNGYLRWSVTIPPY